MEHVNCVDLERKCKYIPLIIECLSVPPRMPSGGSSDWAGSLAVTLSVPKDVYLAKLHPHCANESLTSHLVDSGVASYPHKPDLRLQFLLLDFNNHHDCPRNVFSCLTLIHALFPNRCSSAAHGHVCPYWWICVITDGVLLQMACCDLASQLQWGIS